MRAVGSPYPTSLALAFSVIAILSLCTRAMAEGGPPLIGDDPGTPGNGHWEINIAYIGLRTPRQSTVETPHVDLNYGLGDHLQLKYEVGYLTGKQFDQQVMSGVNNSLFGVKWRFFDEETNGLDMSTYPQVGINTSHSLGRAGVIDSGTNVYLPLEAAKTFGKWELDAEAGYQFSDVEHNQFIGGFILGYKLTEKLELLGEVRATVDDNYRRTDIVLDGGARFAINDNIAIIAAAGRSIRTDAQSTTLYAYAGVRVTF
jgi:hypothetical protein